MSEREKTGVVERGWTLHGHRIAGMVQVDPQPPVARCGGPRMCAACALDVVAAIELQAKHQGLPAVTKASAYTPRPGDVVVLEVPANVTTQHADALKQHASHAFGTDVKVVVLVGATFVDVERGGVRRCADGSTVHDFRGQPVCPGCGWSGITFSEVDGG